jgi:hypothetical protein
VRRVADGCHQFARGDVGIASDHGGGMVPEVVGADALNAHNRTGDGSGVGQVLPAEGEPCGSSEDEGIGRRRHVVLEVVLEDMQDEGWERDGATAGFGLGGVSTRPSPVSSWAWRSTVTVPWSGSTSRRCRPGSSAVRMPAKPPRSTRHRSRASIASERSRTVVVSSLGRSWACSMTAFGDEALASLSQSRGPPGDRATRRGSPSGTEGCIGHERTTTISDEIGLDDERQMRCKRFDNAPAQKACRASEVQSPFVWHLPYIIKPPFPSDGGCAALGRAVGPSVPPVRIFRLTRFTPAGNLLDRHARFS